MTTTYCCVKCKKVYPTQIHKIRYEPIVGWICEECFRIKDKPKK